MGNDIHVLDRLFWDSPHTLRYGAGENLHGYDAIRAFRQRRLAGKLAREVTAKAICTWLTGTAERRPCTLLRGRRRRAGAQFRRSAPEMCGGKMNGCFAGSRWVSSRQPAMVPGENWSRIDSANCATPAPQPMS